MTFGGTLSESTLKNIAFSAFVRLKPSERASIDEHDKGDGYIPYAKAARLPYCFLRHNREQRKWFLNREIVAYCKKQESMTS